MIILSQLPIYSNEEIVDFRNKCLILFLELGWSDMDSTRIVTRLSDFANHILRLEERFNVKFSFENREKKYILLIVIEVVSSNMNEIKQYCLFSKVTYVSNENANLEIIIPFDIKDADFTINEQQLDKLKEKLIAKSKTELVREIIKKNAELKKLVQELKNSAKLIQSEKMRALGVLTAGVAHELNNPMMGILNFIQYCLKKTPKEDERHEALIDAEKETRRCIDIVSNLLTFSHLEKENENTATLIDARILAERVIRFLSFRLRNEKVFFEEEISDVLPKVLGHENRLQQVFLNLVTNALDAMKNVETKRLKIKIHADQDSIKITIADTGEGMDEETKQKLFEPFFTTKPTGSGTGLGLSVCESIVKEHKGTISYNSEKNNGTQFYITLPISS